MKKVYQSLKDHVYDYIATEIQNGTLLPNHKINEVELSKKLEVSRTPVREALIQLASENYLEYLPRRGFIVKELDTKKKLDVFKVVSVLDALAATLSLEQITENDIKEMEEYTNKIDIAISEKNYSDYQKYQKEFHNVYLKKCNNSTLTDILASLQNSFVRQVYSSDDEGKLFSVSKQMNEDHREIIMHFKKQDGNQLEHLIKKHWEIKHKDMI
ncbi:MULTISPECIES: GntR family transcriptional regulator [Bacillus]|uniref:GntR family transcriptional regulator n=1 Tax=Bacillus gobiensis TaxID=1441095 RepID=A0A0M4FUR7_9BACI|nr:MULTISPECIES: GntR family transcriptional regulator [Bacillus]ALC80275.1 GntR family transcriptional regulator [Bacillus gobiensis]MED1098374.1 GntR family transcriptional regulator [Bacillus capparidis]